LDVKNKHYTCANLGGAEQFENRVNYGVRSIPSSVAAFDLEGDGDLDLITANSQSFNISILKNLSDPCNNYSKGDLNGDINLTASDVVLMLNCVFRGSGNCLFCFADVNCDDNLTPTDVVFELLAVFMNQGFPC
jgi:hypothetical protein